MKNGGGAGGAPATKRRWRGLVVGVLGLVVLSMLVPLGFLLGLHNGFQTPGFASDQGSASNTVQVYDRETVVDKPDQSESQHVDDLVRRLAPNLPENIFKKSTNTPQEVSSSSSSEIAHKDVSKKVLPSPAQKVPVPSPKIQKSSSEISPIRKTLPRKLVDENGKVCELKYGSYCLWRNEHREDMKDAMVKKLKDQLFVARAYYPTIAKLPAQDKLSQEMKQNIQELERIFSEATTDADLPAQPDKRLKRIEAVIAKAKKFPVDCHNVDKKLRQLYDMTEDEANFHMKQSAFLYQLAVQTMPKSLHCLSMRLTVEYFKSPGHEGELALMEKYKDPSLHHYAIFTSNILAISVVINSTVMHSKESARHVFHVLTSRQNFYATKQWFIRNTYKEATVQVINVEDLNLDNEKLDLELPVEYRVSLHTADRTEYLSTFSHSHYLLPQVFPNLNKIVVLDDDVVVQKDLSPLWSIDLGGNVIGAPEMCSVRLKSLKRYLGANAYDENSCTWMSGLNVIDLDKWRELDLTGRHQRFVKELSTREGTSEFVALGATLLTFQDTVYPLDDAWALSGLGYDYGLDIKSVKRAAILHYNGNMKPWLELGIPKYKNFWRNFRNQDEQFLSDCNVSL